MDLTEYGISNDTVSAPAAGAISHLFTNVDLDKIKKPVVSSDPYFGVTFEWVDETGGTLIARVLQSGETELFHLHRAKNSFFRTVLEEDRFYTILSLIGKI